MSDLYLRLNNTFLKNSTYRSTGDIARNFERYITQNKDKIGNCIQEMLEFIREKGVTHYITRVDLGALRYFDYESTNTELNVGGSISAPVEYVNLEAAAKVMRIESFSRSRIRSFGNVDTVKPFNCDGVIESCIRPVYTLLQPSHVKTQRHLKDAIESYTSKCTYYVHELDFYDIIIPCVHAQQG